jgi:hypothetical protein
MTSASRCRRAAADAGTRWGAAVVVLVAGCAPPPPPAEVDAGPTTLPDRDVCGRSYQETPTETAPLADDELIEVSGVVASPSAPGVLWLHNDSGNPSRLYAAAVDGRAIARVELPVDLVDAEDIAAAPCPDDDGLCLWIADTGNRPPERDDLSIVVVREPEVSAADVERRLEIDDAWVFPVSYPGAATDAEALVVAPDASALWLIEKVDGDARIFELAAPFDERGAVLEEVGVMASPGIGVPRGLMITGADLHTSGRQLVLRTYTGSWEYRFDEGQGPADLADINPLTVTLGPLSEGQGEAIAYDDEGIGLWTVSEDPDQLAPQPLHHYDCI